MRRSNAYATRREPTEASVEVTNALLEELGDDQKAALTDVVVRGVVVRMAEFLRGIVVIANLHRWPTSVIWAKSVQRWMIRTNCGSRSLA